MSTIIEISEIQYSNEDKRNTITILRLHNLTWLHYELCKDFSLAFTSLDSRNSLGCTFMQSPAMHPSNMKLCALDPVMQKMKRLFGLAKAIALNTTNRQPSNILPPIIMRLQVKLQQNEMFKSQNQQCNAGTLDQCTSPRTHRFLFNFA